MSILTIDVGTSSIRAAIVDPDGTLRFARQQANLPDTPFPGLVEFDAATMATIVRDLATAAMTAAGDVTAVGIANQRGSAIVWDRATGEPVGPGLGWQDLRTVGQCLELRAEGIGIAPNETATKLAAILDQADPGRERDLCVGTVDTWVAWTLSQGECHVTDMSNAAVTGMVTPTTTGLEWNETVTERLGIPAASLPQIIDSTGVFGMASALPGAPPLAGILGDQQSSLVGQSCVRPGQTKLTFGTGGMLDMVVGGPGAAERGTNGTFPIIAWGAAGQAQFGIEAIMLAAGTNVEWLRDDLGLIDTADQAEALAASVESTDGVWFVPAPMGFATPHWDYGARSTLLGVTRGTGQAHIVRAVLAGVAHRGADLVAAAEADAGIAIDTIRVDGGMSRNPLFMEMVANATGCIVEVAAVAECTALGAGFVAGMGTGVWAGWDDIASLWQPARIVEPTRTDDARQSDRDRWAEAVSRATEWIPELSSLEV